MDKEERKRCDRDRQRRHRAKNKGVTSEGVTESVTVIKAESHVGASDIGMVKALHEAINKPKRGADIKCFADLPLDVQRTIDSISADAEDKARRTAIAIHYQHLFPNRYESTGFAGTPNLGSAQGAVIC